MFSTAEEIAFTAGLMAQLANLIHPPLLHRVHDLLKIQKAMVGKCRFPNSWGKRLVAEGVL